MTPNRLPEFALIKIFTTFPFILFLYISPKSPRIIPVVFSCTLYTTSKSVITVACVVFIYFLTLHQQESNFLCNTLIFLRINHVRVTSYHTFNKHTIFKHTCSMSRQTPFLDSRIKHTQKQQPINKY